MSDNAASGDLADPAVHPDSDDHDPALTADTNNFDPDTLASLAALSRITHDEDSDEDAKGEDIISNGQQGFPALLEGRVTREQVQEFVDGLGTKDSGHTDIKNGGIGEEEGEDEALVELSEEGQSDGRSSGDESRSGDEDDAKRDPRYVFGGGSLKRKRNRTTL